LQSKLAVNIGKKTSKRLRWVKQNMIAYNDEKSSEDENIRIGVRRLNWISDHYHSDKESGRRKKEFEPS
jgi:hypothetical protein